MSFRSITPIRLLALLLCLATFALTHPSQAQEGTLVVVDEETKTETPAPSSTAESAAAPQPAEPEAEAKQPAQPESTESAESTLVVEEEQPAAEPEPAQTVEAGTAGPEKPAAEGEAPGEEAPEISEPEPQASMLRSAESFVVSKEEAQKIVFDKFLEENEDEISSFMDAHGEDLFAASVPHIGGIFWSFFILQIIIIAITYAASAFICGFMLVEKGIDNRNLRIGTFAGINTVVYAILSVLLYFAFTNVTSRVPGPGDILMFIAWGLIFEVLVFFVMVPTAIVAFDMTGGRGFVFGIAFFFCSTIMAVIVGLVLSPVTSASMQSSMQNAMIAAIADWQPIIEREIKVERERLQRLGSTSEDAGEVAMLRNKTFQAKKRIASIEKVLEKHQDSPMARFASIGEFVDEGKFDEAKAAYLDFLKDNRDHDLAIYAERMADRVNRLKAEAIAAKQKAEEEAKMAEIRKEQEFKDKIRKGDVTLGELREHIQNFTRDEVEALLGPPDEIATNRYIYKHSRKVVDFVNKRSRGFFIYFEVGRVKTVGYQN